MVGSRLVAVLIGLVSLTWFAVATDEAHVPDQIDYSMFFEADIRDTLECDTRVVGRMVVFGDAVTNPTISCPDSFAWKTFAEITTQEWWENWSTDRQMFPSDPWPRCEPGQSANCCPDVVGLNDVWPQHCPVFPGLVAGVPAHVVERPSKAHRVALAQAASVDVNGDGKNDWADVPAILKNAVIGAVDNELIYRNEQMVDYIFDPGLYSVDGLAAVYTNFVKAIGAYAPRWPTPADPAATHPSVPPVARINFPIKAIMVKANWLAVDQAVAYGIDPDDTEHPHIVMDLVPEVDTNAPPANRR